MDIQPGLLNNQVGITSGRDLRGERELWGHELTDLQSEKLSQNLVQPRTDEYGPDQLF